MKLTKKKGKIISKLSTMGTILSLLAIKCNMSLAADSGIGTAEVRTATENIKRVI